MSAKIKEKVDASVEGKLKSLYQLQLIDSKIDRLRTIRGELPLEVSDLEDTVAGLETRLTNVTEEVAELENSLNEKKQAIKDFQANIKKYEAQQGKVRNNREYDAISKEIEIQGLDIQVSEKKIREYGFEISSKTQIYEKALADLEGRRADLDVKKEELGTITSETEKDENDLNTQAETAKQNIEERLLTAYSRLRGNAKNGLAVVTIQRDSCSGCFNQIPPQRQSDIRQRKKIIVCEHCGRILIDEQMALEAEEATV